MHTDEDGKSTMSVGLSRLFPIVTVKDGDSQESEGPDVHVRGVTGKR